MHDPKSGQATISRDVIVDEVEIWKWESTRQEASTIVLEDETTTMQPDACDSDVSVRRSSRITQLPIHLRYMSCFVMLPLR